jgi:hypothetical protein
VELPASDVSPTAVRTGPTCHQPRRAPVGTQSFRGSRPADRMRLCPAGVGATRNGVLARPPT